MLEKKAEKPATPEYTGERRTVNVNSGRETKVVGAPAAKPEAEKKGGK